MQYGVRTDTGEVVSEKHWTSIAELFKGSHGFGMRHIAAWGVLVYLEDGEWKEVPHDRQP